MGSNTVAKTVAKQLKYYFDVKRLEDGFDLSSQKTSHLDRPPCKAPVVWNPYLVRPTLQHEGLHDRALKHYFSQPEVRAQLTRLEPAEAEEHSPRERQIKKSLKNTMKKYHFGKSTVPEWFYVYSLGGPRPQQTAGGYRTTSAKSRKTRSVKSGWPMVHAAPEPDVPPDEAERLIHNASRILVNAESGDHRSRGQPRAKTAMQRYPLRPVEKPRGDGKSRPLTAKYTWDTNGHRLPSAKVKAQDSQQDTAPRRTYLRRPQSSPRPANQKPVKVSEDSTSTPRDSATPTPASRSNDSTRRRQQGVMVGMPADHADDEEVEEVAEGAEGKYEVTVITGNYIGASTTAAVHLTIYGEKGRSPNLHLEASQFNKVKFQRGKEDRFILKTPHVGQLLKVKIGHDRPELSYAWYLDSLAVHDVREGQVYQFPCHRWLSGQDEDRNTHCTFLVHQPDTDTEKPDSTVERKTESKTPETKPSSVSPNTHTDPIRRQPSGKAPRKTDPVRRPGTRRTQNKENDVRGQPSSEPEAQSKSESSKPSKDRQDKRGKDRKPQPVDEDFLAGYQAGVEAIEASERQRRDEERKASRQLLSGPSLHDACHRGDLDRVHVLLDNFPEMKDSTDENGWTPLHIAANTGQVEVIRRLTAAGCDSLDVETPTGYTPTHLAAMSGHCAAVKILNAMGASVDCKTADNQTPLHLASSAGHVECVKCLVANGADLTTEDAFSRTPLDLAQQYDQDAVADFLQRCQDDLANPSSTFAQMHQSQNKEASETAAPTAGKKHSKKDSRQGEEAQGPRPMTSTQRKKAKEKKELEEKREQYEEQHRHMEETGVSFLDLIRQEMGDEP